MQKLIPRNHQTIFDRISDRLFLLLLRYLAQKALKNLQTDTANAAQVQHQTLKRILTRQKNTEYGKKYNFAAIQSVTDFKNKHPLTTYEDYRSLIENIANTGNFTQLVAEPIILFQETAGTTGKTKLIPRTKSLFSTYQKAIQAVIGLTESYYLQNQKQENNYRGLAFSNADALKFTPSGIPRGTGTSGGLRQSKFVHNLLRLKYTSPPSVFLISNYKIAYYCHLLFGLLETNLSYIGANFASNVLQALQILEKVWPQLVNDIHSGQIEQSLVIDASIREELHSYLKPNIARAEILRIEFEKGFQGILPRIWPQLTHIQCITTGSMQIYQDNLQFYAGDIPIYTHGYGASESWVGVNLEPEKQPPGYVITPHSAFFEFIPVSDVDANTPNAVDLTSLSVGESYEIVVTTLAGLYRYRLGDVVKCIGYYHQTPIVEFLYRQGSLLNLNGEKVSENTILTALTDAIKILGNGCQIVDYTTKMEFSNHPWRYVIYLEVSPIFVSPPNLKLCQEKMEQAIYDLNENYLRLRQVNSIGPLELKLVKNGAFESLKNQMIGQGTSATQFKMPRLLKNLALTGFLETMVVWRST